MKRTYLRGDMYFANLGSGIGSEQIGRLDKRHLAGLDHALAVSVDLTRFVSNPPLITLCGICADNCYKNVCQQSNLQRSVGKSGAHKLS